MRLRFGNLSQRISPESGHLEVKLEDTGLGAPPGVVLVVRLHALDLDQVLVVGAGMSPSIQSAHVFDGVLVVQAAQLVLALVVGSPGAAVESSPEFLAKFACKVFKKRTGG